MSEAFDPYRKWLGIAPHEQPPHHYRLLGVVLFEDDADAIQNAADQRMAHIRTFQNGPNRAHSQKILNELAAAKVTLLDPAKRAAYDAKLREQMDGGSAIDVVEVELAPPPAPLPPSAPPPRLSPPLPEPASAPPPVPVPRGQAVSAVAAAPVAVAGPAVPVVKASRGSTAARARSRKQSSIFPLLAGLVGIGAVLVGLLVFVVSQTDEKEKEKEKGPTKPTAPLAEKEKSNGKKHIPKPAPKPNEKPTPTETPEKDPRPAPSDPSKKPPLPPAEQFRAAVSDARAALAQRELPKAKIALDQADFTKSGQQQEQEVEHLRHLYRYLDEFWTAVRAGIYERMQEGDVAEYGGDEIELVKREGEIVTVKERQRELSSEINKLPPHVAALFARQALDTKEARAHLSLAAFWTLDAAAIKSDQTQERAKRSWVDAAERGVKDNALAKELALDEAFVSSAAPKPNDPPLNPKPSPMPSDPPPGSRVALPAGEPLRDAKQRFEKRYGEEVARARNKPAEYELLLTKLETEAQNEKDPVLKYVIYEEACEAAVTVLRHDLLLKLVDAMAAQWEIDALRAKQQWLSKARPQISPATENFADAAAALAKEAEAAGRIDVAAAAGSYSLRIGDKIKMRDQKELTKKVREWDVYVEHEQKAAAGQQALAANPNDAAAHASVGRFLCFFKNDWPTGLKHLSQGNNDEERQLAMEDLAAPTEAASQAALAERWYMHAKKKSGAARLATLNRAKHWFDAALPMLDPAGKTTAENRLRDIAKEAAL